MESQEWSVKNQSLLKASHKWDTGTFRGISLGWQITREDCSVFDCVCPWDVNRWQNICAPRCVGGGDGSCGLYNSHRTNDIYTQRIVGLPVVKHCISKKMSINGYSVRMLCWLLSDSLLSILFSTKASFLYEVTSTSSSTRGCVSGGVGLTMLILHRGLQDQIMFFKLLLNGVLCKLYTIGLMHELKVTSRIPSWSAGEPAVTWELNWSRRNMTLFGIHVKM